MVNKKNWQEYHDMFNLCHRIKLINKDYVLVYDNFNKLFIIINSANNNEICLNFTSFNINIENILLKTSVKNAKELFSEIENINTLKQDNALKKTKEEFSDKAKDLISYSARTDKISRNDINKILGVKND